MLKRYWSLAAVLVTLLIVVPLRAEVIEQVLVRVNGDIVSKTEFEQRQVSVLRQRPELSNVSPDSPELKKAIAEVTPNLILDAVDELLLVQRGRELGYVLGDEQFKSIVDNIKKQNNLEDDTRFQDALRQEGMTMTDLRRSLERQMLVSRVQQVDVVDKISVTEDESKAYYEAHKQEFTTPSAITLREVLIQVPTTEQGINVAQDDAAKVKAAEIRKRALGGEPFPSLVSEASDAPSKANGGLIGPISREELTPEFQKLVDSMKIGDVSEPLRVERGYQVLKLDARAETKIKTFDEARSEISEKVAEQKRRSELQKYLDRLRAQATIQWRNDELKKAYEQALSARGKA